jgi:hypothetical protein
MATYLIESPHTKQECLDALDALREKPDLLSKFEWGCMAGEHTGYAVVDAPNEQAVRGLIPDNVRGKAKILAVTKFTPQQIEGFHAR